MFIHFVSNSDFEVAPCPCPQPALPRHRHRRRQVQISSAMTPFQVPIQPVLVYMYLTCTTIPHHTIPYHHPLPIILHIVSRVKKKPRSREQSRAEQSSVEMQAAPPPENCNLWRILRTQRPLPTPHQKEFNKQIAQHTCIVLCTSLQTRIKKNNVGCVGVLCTWIPLTLD